MKRTQYVWIDISRTSKKYTPLTYTHVNDAMQYIDRCYWYYPDIELPLLGILESFANFIRTYCRCIFCKRPVRDDLGACACGKQGKLIEVEFLTDLFRPDFEEVLNVQSWTDRTDRKAFRRRKRLADAGGSYANDEIKQLYAVQNGRCYYCRTTLMDTAGKNSFHVDHYISIAEGGTNDLANLVLACPVCNIQKGAENGDIFSRKITKSLNEEYRLEVRKLRQRVSRFKANQRKKR